MKLQACWTLHIYNALILNIIMLLIFSSQNKKKPEGYGHHLVLPLKLIACWDWYENPKRDREIFINNMYLATILFFTISRLSSLTIEIYLGWTDFISSLDLLNEASPVIVMLSMVIHCTIYKDKLYELIQYIDDNFKWHSARGLTNMTMQRSYETAKRFTHFYMVCVFFSVTMYVWWPIIIHLVTEQPLPWIYAGETSSIMIAIILLRHYLLEIAISIVYGQSAAIFATITILIAGQLDLLCCSLHNLRHTAFLKNNVQYEALVSQFKDIVEDERHRYSYNEAVMKDFNHRFDMTMKYEGNVTQFDAYSLFYDDDRCNAIRDCAKMYQAINTCKRLLEDFISHVLVIRIIQSVIFLCVTLYVATLKFDLATIEFVAAGIFDIFLICYFGNQIIIQTDRVLTAAYLSGWHTMGVRPRRLLLHIMMSCRRPLMIRAGNFLPIDLNTFVMIIKTSFSYYTILLNLNQ